MTRAFSLAWGGIACAVLVAGIRLSLNSRFPEKRLAVLPLLHWLIEKERWGPIFDAVMCINSISIHIQTGRREQNSLASCRRTQPLLGAVAGALKPGTKSDPCYNKARQLLLELDYWQ